MYIYGQSIQRTLYLLTKVTSILFLDILVTPLLNQQTSLHLNYLINILQGALVQGEELKK